MTHEKINKFLQVAIDKTKSGALIWARAQDSRELDHFSRNRYVPIDYQRSFLSKYGIGTILLLVNENTNDLSCFLRPDDDLSFQQICNDDNPMLLRLYNVVYAQFPSVESFIDNFISDS